MILPRNAVEAAPVMTGHLRRTPNGIAGSLLDVLGYVTVITGTPVPGGWAITATVIEPSSEGRRGTST